MSIVYIINMWCVLLLKQFLNFISKMKIMTYECFLDTAVIYS